MSAQRPNDPRSEKTHVEERHDVSNVLLESEIDHSICLVHTHVLAAFEREPFLLQHVNESAGRGDDDMQALVENSSLLSHGYPADTQEGVELREPAFCECCCPLLDIFVRLGSQLSL